MRDAPESAEARPRLLVLTSTYPRWPGDPEPGFVHELAKRLASRFHVTVLGPHAPGAKPRETMDGVEVVRYRYAPERMETLVNDGGIVTNLKRSKWKLLLVPTFVLAQAWHAWRLARQERIDVIHAHWLLPQGLIAALLQSLPGTSTPFVVTSHGADLYALRGGFLEALKRFVLRRSAAATVVSGAMLGKLASLGAATGKIAVLSMGVDVSNRFGVDASIGRSSDEILFVGRLVEKKGVHHLIRALPAVLARRPTARLTIGGFGPEEPALRGWVERLGLQSAVTFLGALPQSELPALYRRAAVFVAPFVQAESGDQEGLPVALMEAIACGCPVIAGDVAGLHDLLGEHARDVALDPRDGEALAARIGDVLSNPDAARDRALHMGAHVRQRFDWENIAGNYGAILEAAIGK
jgi:glycosyltransferase involved in cell wall biosynthesis